MKYVNAKSAAEALSALISAGGNALIVAGGSDVMVDIHEGKISPEMLVDVTSAEDMKGIRVEGDELVIGGDQLVLLLHVGNELFVKGPQLDTQVGEQQFTVFFDELIQELAYGNIIVIHMGVLFFLIFNRCFAGFGCRIAQPRFPYLMTI